MQSPVNVQKPYLYHHSKTWKFSTNFLLLNKWINKKNTSKSGVKCSRNIDLNYLTVGPFIPVDYSYPAVYGGMNSNR